MGGMGTPQARPGGDPAPGGDLAVRGRLGWVKPHRRLTQEAAGVGPAGVRSRPRSPASVRYAETQSSSAAWRGHSSAGWVRQPGHGSAAAAGPHADRIGHCLAQDATLPFICFCQLRRGDAEHLEQ